MTIIQIDRNSILSEDTSAITCQIMMLNQKLRNNPAEFSPFDYEISGFSDSHQLWQNPKVLKWTQLIYQKNPFFPILLDSKSLTFFLRTLRQNPLESFETVRSLLTELLANSRKFYYDLLGEQKGEEFVEKNRLRLLDILKNKLQLELPKIFDQSQNLKEPVEEKALNYSIRIGSILFASAIVCVAVFFVFRLAIEANLVYSLMAGIIGSVFTLNLYYFIIVRKGPRIIQSSQKSPLAQAERIPVQCEMKVSGVGQTAPVKEKLKAAQGKVSAQVIAVSAEKQRLETEALEKKAETKPKLKEYDLHPFLLKRQEKAEMANSTAELEGLGLSEELQISGIDDQAAVLQSADSQREAQEAAELEKIYQANIEKVIRRFQEKNANLFVPKENQAVSNKRVEDLKDAMKERALDDILKPQPSGLSAKEAPAKASGAFEKLSEIAAPPLPKNVPESSFEKVISLPFKKMAEFFKVAEPELEAIPLAAKSTSVVTLEKSPAPVADAPNSIRTQKYSLQADRKISLQKSEFKTFERLFNSDVSKNMDKRVLPKLIFLDRTSQEDLKEVSSKKFTKSCSNKACLKPIWYQQTVEKDGKLKKITDVGENCAICVSCRKITLCVPCFQDYLKAGADYGCPNCNGRIWEIITAAAKPESDLDNLKYFLDSNGFKYENSNLS